jgi:hypothetical protein
VPDTWPRLTRARLRPVAHPCARRRRRAVCTETSARCTHSRMRWVARSACANRVRSPRTWSLPSMRASPFPDRLPEPLPSTHLCGPSIVLLCSCRLTNRARRPFKVLETILGYLQTRQDCVAAAVMALLAAQGFGAPRPLVAGLSADAAVVYAWAPPPLLEAASVRAARRHAAPARVGRGACTGSLPRDEKGGDGSASPRDLGGRQIRGSAPLSAAARAMTVRNPRT